MSKKNPADKIEFMSIKDLVPYARNSRTHSNAQIDQIAESIKEWGFTTAVLVDSDGGIIAGHGRVLAARRIGMESVPVMIADGWTDAQKRAYVIADNKLALNAGWDEELLALELEELRGLDFDLELIGFDESELDKILKAAEELKEKEIEIRPIKTTWVLVKIYNDEIPANISTSIADHARSQKSGQCVPKQV